MYCNKWLCLCQVAEHLAQTYGDKSPQVAKLAAITGHRWPVVGKKLVEEFPYIEAEVTYAVRHEYACTAIDMVARRTRLAFLNVQAADEALPAIVRIMGKELGWSSAKQKVIFRTGRRMDRQTDRWMDGWMDRQRQTD